MKLLFRINPFKRNNIFVLVFYFILTIILTYPVAFRIGTEIPGSGDAFHWMRNLWYFKYAIINPDITSITFDKLLFFPNGVPVSPFPSAFNQFMYIFLSPFLDLHQIFTILWLLTFILGAYGTFLLVKYLTNNNYAAFISGLIYAFSPYHLIHSSGHFGATTIQWIPFCGLYLMRMLNDGGTRNSVYAGLFFILVAMSDMQYMVFTGLFVGLLFIYDFYHSIQKQDFESKTHKFKIFLSKYIIFAVVVFPGLLLLTIHDILNAISKSIIYKPNPMEAVTYSTDLLSFFLPSVLHPIFGNIVQPIYSNFSGNATEHTTFIGYSVIILSIYAYIHYKKTNNFKFWIITALSFSIFSLGPILHIGGQTTFTVFNTTVPLPHIFLYYVIPFLENCRTTGRFFVIASLAFAVLAGYGITKVLEVTKKRDRLISILLIIIILFEFLCIPFTTSAINQPQFFKDISNDKQQYGILEIPSTLTNYKSSVETIYFQTIHHKPLVGNHLARLPKSARDFELKTPFIRQLTLIDQYKDTNIDQHILKDASFILNYNDIKYIIIHKKYLNEEQERFVIKMLNDSLGANALISSDELLYVYKIPEIENNLYNISAIFGKNGTAQIYQVTGWSDPEEDFTWTDGHRSVLGIKSSNADSDLNLTITASQYSSQQRVNVTVNDHSVGNWIFNNPEVQEKNIVIPHGILNEGIQYIAFDLPDAKSPKSLGLSNDGRTLALAVRSLMITNSTEKIYPEYKYGDTILFGKDGTSEQYQMNGWSGPEEGFTWTDGHKSVLGIQTPKTDTDLNLTITASQFTSQQLVNVTVNGHHVGEWVFDKPDVQEKSIEIPQGILNEGMQYIAFNLPDAKSPQNLGLSDDVRVLALAVQSIVITNLIEPTHSE